MVLSRRLLTCVVSVGCGALANIAKRAGPRTEQGVSLACQSNVSEFMQSHADSREPGCGLHVSFRGVELQRMSSRWCLVAEPRSWCRVEVSLGLTWQNWE